MTPQCLHCRPVSWWISELMSHSALGIQLDVAHEEEVAVSSSTLELVFVFRPYDYLIEETQAYAEQQWGHWYMALMVATCL